MSEDEALAFDRDPRRDAKLRLRSWDEQAKVPGLEVEPLDTHWTALEAVFVRSLPSFTAAPR